ncbi:MAG: hypothetical protein BJ554DRAFT_6042, partial [Olpidium bornovanus]
TSRPAASRSSSARPAPGAPLSAKPPARPAPPRPAPPRPGATAASDAARPAQPALSHAAFRQLPKRCPQSGQGKGSPRPATSAPPSPPAAPPVAMRKAWKNLLRRTAAAAAAAARRRRAPPAEPGARRGSSASAAAEFRLRAPGDAPAVGCCVGACCSPVRRRPSSDEGGRNRTSAACRPSSGRRASRRGKKLRPPAESLVAELPSVRYAVFVAPAAAGEEDPRLRGASGGRDDAFSAVGRAAATSTDAAPPVRRAAATSRTAFSAVGRAAAASTDASSAVRRAAADSTGAGSRARTSSSESRRPSVFEKCGRLLAKSFGCSAASSDLTWRSLHPHGRNKTVNGAEEQFFGPARPRGLVFGVRLSDLPRAATALVAVGEMGACRVPVILERWTGVTGIFRVCGSLRRMAELQGRFDGQPAFGTDINLSPGGEYTVHDVASAVRRYLTELPESVIPEDMYDVFRATYDEFRDDEDEQVARYKVHILNLPPTHRDVLAFITDSLAVFALHAESTLMSVENLAAVFQPGLLNHPDHCADPGEYVRNQQIVATLIQRSDDLFRPPPVRVSERAPIDSPSPVPPTFANPPNTATAWPPTTLKRTPATRQGRLRQGEAPKRGAALLPEKRKSSTKIVSLRRSATVNCVSFDSRTAADIPREVSPRRSSCTDVRHALDLSATAAPKPMKVLDASSLKACFLLP